MVVHICLKCKKEFNKKSMYIAHINKKFDCTPINKNSEIFPDVKKNSEIFQEKEIFYKEENLEINNENINYIYCNLCNKTFSTVFNLNKHCKFNCKVKKLKDEEKENIFKILLAKDEEIKKKDEDNKRKEEESNKINEQNQKKYTKLEINYKNLQKNNKYL